MGSDNLKQVGIYLFNEFERSWGMLKQAIKNIDSEYWSKMNNDWSFVGTVLHIIETADYYRRNDPKEMEWGKKVEINWETDTEEIRNKRVSNISKEDLLNYLEETENLLSNELKVLENDDFLKEDGFTFQGLESVLHKLIHLLRHTMHHIGELNKTLRDIECKRINWL
ncbi:MAG: DinB family protein [Candidatus Hodarchaeales archaeon]|jgi:uncharacterized damage-inducible protein DinB